MLTIKNDISQGQGDQADECDIKMMDIENLVTLLKLCLVVAVNCEVTEQIIGSFTEKLNETTLDELM